MLPATFERAGAALVPPAAVVVLTEDGLLVPELEVVCRVNDAGLAVELFVGVGKDCISIRQITTLSRKPNSGAGIGRDRRCTDSIPCYCRWGISYITLTRRGRLHYTRSSGGRRRTILRNASDIASSIVPRSNDTVGEVTPSSRDVGYDDTRK